MRPAVEEHQFSINTRIQGFHGNDSGLNGLHDQLDLTVFMEEWDDWCDYVAVSQPLIYHANVLEHVGGNLLRSQQKPSLQRQSQRSPYQPYPYTCKYLPTAVPELWIFQSSSSRLAGL